MATRGRSPLVMADVVMMEVLHGLPDELQEPGRQPILPSYPSLREDAGLPAERWIRCIIKQGSAVEP